MHSTKAHKSSGLLNKISSRTLSIKKLTLLGFTLAVVPLVFALIYSAVKVSQISKQASQTIFSVVNLTTITSELIESQLKLERFASQYIILNDEELKESYLRLERQVLVLIDSEISVYQDEKLTRSANELKRVISAIHLQFDKETTTNDRLRLIENDFITVSKISQSIDQRGRELIRDQAVKINLMTQQVSNTILLSLLIIPITLLIAGIFVYLITTPLKLLISKIENLERGEFDNQIKLNGTIEVREIANALEMMRLRLQALELQKSSFIRHISHELKTPLAAMREGTELLYDNSVGELNDAQQEVCEIIKTSVSRLQLLIEELLNFNIVLDSTSLQDREAIFIHALVEEVISDHILDIKKKNLQIIPSLGKITVYSNYKQLKVILDNIISNAIKYSKEKGRISIDCLLKNEQLQLSIEDNGVGINENIQGNVFDAFYQGPEPKSDHIKSSGLGLTIVKELIMRLNGDIQLISQTKEVSGTKIQITLPKAERLVDTA